MEFSHELVLPNEDLPFRMFLFEGKDGNYVREKHWHRSIEMFVVLEGKLDFYINEEDIHLDEKSFVIVNSNELHSISAPFPNKTIVLQMPHLNGIIRMSSLSVLPTANAYRMNNWLNWLKRCM